MKTFGWILLVTAVADAQNFTGGSSAKKFGVHEIVLSGNGAVANPFDTPCAVTFSAPSGATKTVHAFFDGGSTWRARVYVSETGTWTWRSSSSDAGLNARSGSFSAGASALPGRLLLHPSNPKHWITEDGRWFINLNDTAYHLFSPRDREGQAIPELDFQNYVKDTAARGITSLRAWSVFASDGTGGFASSNGVWKKAIFEDTAYTLLREENFRRTDDRLIWLFNTHPALGLQLILLPTADYGKDDTFWVALTTAKRQRLMKHFIARYAAFPSVFWLVINDSHYGAGYPNNDAMAREVGQYFAANDPWKHPMSTGPNRDRAYPFPGESWSTYIHIEDQHDLGAAEVARYAAYAKPLFLGEDRYEQDHGSSRDPLHMRYWQRRLFWAWLLSGASANYGGRWWVLHPYGQTGSRTCVSRFNSTVFSKPLVGLDSAGVIPGYFRSRGISLPDFTPDHGLASDLDGRAGAKAPKLMRRGTSEYLVYHPNAAADGQSAAVASTSARLRVDLSAASGAFASEWFRVHDGLALPGPSTSGGAPRDFTAPWAGQDVVFRLLKTSTSQTPFAGTPAPLPGTIEAERYDLGGPGVAFHDTTSGNAGGAFRSEDVDIQATTGGYNVGWLAAGEWMEYTVNVGSAGAYALEARVATPNSGKTFRVEAGGVDKTGAIGVPTTGDFQSWRLASRSVSLSAGTQVLRVHTDTGGFNLDWIRLSAATTGAFTISVDSVSSGRSYSLSTAQAGALPYVDRSYTIASLGSTLAGAPMIRTAMDDKYVSAATHLRFTLSAPATVYVALDKRAASPPDFLEDGSWTLTALGLSTSDTPASPMRVYAKSASGQVTLGGNHHGGDTLARANYIVIVRPDAPVAASLGAVELIPDAWVHEGDTDGDGLRDGYETATGLNPEEPDSDGNGVPDEHELTPSGASHWDAQEKSSPGSGDGVSSSNCGLLGVEILLFSLLRRRKSAAPPSEAGAARAR